MTTQNNPHKFTLGQRVQCNVTGFVGITIARVDHLNGCVQYLVKPRCLTKENEQQKMPDGNYIDDVQLELVDEGILDPPAAMDLAEQLHEAGGGGRVTTGGPSHREGQLPT